MSKLSQLMGKSKICNIGEIELEIKPLTVKDMDLFMQLEDSKTRSEALNKIIEKTLRVSVPDTTDEELASIGIQYFESLVMAIMEVNGFTISDEKKAFIEKIKNVQSAKSD